MREGDWKLIEFFDEGTAELYHLKSDPSEHKDLSAERPDKVKEMVALWENYVRANNVVLPSRSVFETLEDQLPPRVPDDSGYPPMIYKRQFVPPKDMLADPK